jgi:hypothetical protein
MVLWEILLVSCSYRTSCFIIICIEFPPNNLKLWRKIWPIFISYYCSFHLAKLCCMSRVSNCILQAIILVLHFMAMHPVNSTKNTFYIAVKWINKELESISHACRLPTFSAMPSMNTRTLNSTCFCMEANAEPFLMGSRSNFPDW